MELAKQSKFAQGAGRALNQLGLVAFQTGDFANATNYFLKALKINEQLDYKSGVANTFGYLAKVYTQQRSYDQAINYHTKALKIRALLKDNSGAANTYNNLGLLHNQLKKYDQAIGYYTKSLFIQRKIENQQGMAITYNNIGEAYNQQRNYSNALYYFLKSLQIKKARKDFAGEAITLSNIGNIYYETRQYSLSVNSLIKALEIRQRLNDNQRIAATCNNLGRVLTQQQKYKTAIQYYTQAINLARTIKSNQTLANAHEGLAITYHRMGEHDLAFVAHRRFAQLKDIIFNEQTSKRISQLQARYDVQKKQSQIEQLSKERQLKQDEVSKERMLRNAFIGISFLVIVLAFILYRNSKRDRVSNEIFAHKSRELQQKTIEVEQKNRALNRQKDLITDKNKNITDSLAYAQHIQTAMLPVREEISQYLPEHFIYFNPRDLVSGDFYYFAVVNHQYVLAAIDCTGHGVPGAFMSLIGNNLLNQIVKIQRETNPAEILSRLHDGVVEVLKQKNTDNHDGMDAAICVVNPAKKRLYYAGANNPLLLIQKTKEYPEGNLKVVNPDHQGVGGIFSTLEDAHFTNHSYSIQQPTTFYIFSDGYQDQFGGPDNKKFMRQRLRQWLMDNHHLPMEEQKAGLANTIEQWMNYLPTPEEDEESIRQMDDMLVIGVRLNQ
ncbi:hypothetical protein BKI52_34345 [marine bacterium AO1-C]|nr:hypothetical protein BKI52_34345 [marine bacterium AO1-C]